MGVGARELKACGGTVSLVHAPDRLFRKASGVLAQVAVPQHPGTPGNRSSARQQQR